MAGDRDRKKAYVPWHERVDEELVAEIARQFVADLFTRAKLQITQLSVNWNGREYEISTQGRHLTKIVPDDEDDTH